MKSLIGSIAARLLPSRAFSSGQYWEARYKGGGNSGPGSYGELARFKAKVLNDFVRSHAIQSVIEFGCGDGNQLAGAEYPCYTGYDISPIAVEMCRRRFLADASKQFFLAQEYDGRKADLTLSLDVIFHLTEDEVFDAYMCRLFDASRGAIVIYSSNTEAPVDPDSPHVRHRNFSHWIERERPSWDLVETIPKAAPYNGDYQTTSFCDFFIYRKR